MKVPAVNAIYYRIYLAGYGGWYMPRSVRRIIGGTEFHRAWFLGFTGHFTENGVRYGLANPRGQELTSDL